MIKIRTIWRNLLRYLILEPILWSILILAILGNLSLWYIWYYQTPYNKLVLFYSTTVLLVNFFLALLFFDKDILVKYFLLITALVIQIFAVILLYYSLY